MCNAFPLEDAKPVTVDFNSSTWGGIVHSWTLQKIISRYSVKRSCAAEGVCWFKLTVKSQYFTFVFEVKFVLVVNAWKVLRKELPAECNALNKLELVLAGFRVVLGVWLGNQLMRFLYGPHFCFLQSCLNSLRHGFNKALKTFLWVFGPTWHDGIMQFMHFFGCTSMMQFSSTTQIWFIGLGSGHCKGYLSIWTHCHVTVR